eukprot:gene10046-biopygen7730
MYPLRQSAKCFKPWGGEGAGEGWIDTVPRLLGGRLLACWCWCWCWWWVWWVVVADGGDGGGSVALRRTQAGSLTPLDIRPGRHGAPAQHRDARLRPALEGVVPPRAEHGGGAGADAHWAAESWAAESWAAESWGGGCRGRAKRPRTQRPRTQRPRTQRPRTQRPRTQRPRTQRPRTQRPRTQRPRTQGVRR